MAVETGESNTYFDLNKSSDEPSSKSRKIIETYSLSAVFCLIAAIILLSFNLNLLSGCLIIAAASLGLVVIRKTYAQNRKMTELLMLLPL
jgi:1,4-dihydroxy-2-naphthoate octaprenyltransferase